MSAAVRAAVATGLTLALTHPAVAQVVGWPSYGHDAQHSGISGTPAAPLGAIQWQTPVDLDPQFSGNDLLVHYGSPMVTAGNTVILPVKTGASGGFEVEARSGTNGQLLWTQPTSYINPPLAGDVWTPSYGPTIAAGNRLYYPDAGGTVLYRSNLDTSGAVTPTRVALSANYAGNVAAFNQNVFINTPITADAAGDIYFGFQVTNPAAVGGLQSGIARIDPSGNVVTDSRHHRGRRRDDQQGGAELRSGRHARTGAWCTSPSARPARVAATATATWSPSTAPRWRPSTRCP